MPHYRFSIVLAVLFAAAAAGWLLLPKPVNAVVSNITYVPINPRVFVGDKIVRKWAKTHNEAAVASHAMSLWAGLTQLTNQKIDGVPLAVFATWYTPCDVYPDKSKCNHAIVHNPTTDIEVPEQFFRLPRISSANIFSGVKYNAEMKNFVEQGYNGTSYATGAGLVKAIAAGETDLVDTAAPSAMMTKPVYQMISLTKPTIVPYWQGPGLTVRLNASTSPLVPDTSTWLQIVVVDPTGRQRNTKPVTFCADTIDPTGAIVAHRNYVAPAGSYQVVPLREFYAFPMSASDIANANALRQGYVSAQTAHLVRNYGVRALRQDPGCPNVVPVNPALALVGMHVVSAEFNNTWTWQTFWWNPDVSPIPGTRGPFQHFAFATAYWTLNRPPYDFRVAFNPYLEAGFGTEVFTTAAYPPPGHPGTEPNLGRTTDCISCHSQATYTINPSPLPSPGYVAHGDQLQVPTTNSILTRNLWSLAIRASHPKTTP